MFCRLLTGRRVGARREEAYGFILPIPGHFLLGSLPKVALIPHAAGASILSSIITPYSAFIWSY